MWWLFVTKVIQLAQPYNSNKWRALE